MRMAHTSVPTTPEQVSDLWLARYTSPNTRAAYESDVRLFVAWCAARGSSPWETTEESLAEYRAAREADGVANSSIVRQMSALRSFFDAAESMGLCATPFAGHEDPSEVVSPTSTLTAEEVGLLHAAADRDPRTSALVHLLLGTGLRLAEVLAIDHEHLSGSVNSMRLAVAARRDRNTFVLSRETACAVRRLRKSSATRGPLFLAKRSSNGSDTRLTRFGADLLIKRAAGAADIARSVSANVLRRTYVATARDAGDDIDVIRRNMGQRDVRTTRRYLSPQQPQPHHQATTPKGDPHVHASAFRSVP